MFSLNYSLLFGLTIVLSAGSTKANNVSDNFIEEMNVTDDLEKDTNAFGSFVLVRSEAGSEPTIICAAAIISDFYVITSAGCILDNNPLQYKQRELHVYASAANFKTLDGSIRTNVDTLHVPHDYIEYHTDDIALLRLEEPLQSSVLRTKRVSLPDGPPPYGENCSMHIWGPVVQKGPMLDRPVEAETVLLSHNECRKMIQTLLPDMLCTTKSDRGVNCATSNGGSLICNEALVGIGVRSIRCRSDNFPIIFTDVYKHLDWIERHINAAVSFECHIAHVICIALLWIVFN